jgi:histidine triad (HIT) family protein
MGSGHLDCFVCEKLRGQIDIPGGAIFEDEVVYCGHAWPQEGDGEVYLGACVVEPRRHVESWGELSDQEAGRLGMSIRDTARALIQSEQAEHAYVFVLGHHVPHLHVWVVPRYADTPRAYWGLKLFEWPQRPRGNAEQVSQLCSRLRAVLQVVL